MCESVWRYVLVSEGSHGSLGTGAWVFEAASMGASEETWVFCS